MPHKEVMMMPKARTTLFRSFQSGKPSVIPMDQVIPNAVHPFDMDDDEELQLLADSMKENGLIHPIVVRPMPDGNFEIIAGHRRTEAAKKNGWTEISAFVVELDDDTAIILMVESNKYQRDFRKMRLKVQAVSLKMQMDARKRRSMRSDIVDRSVQDGIVEMLIDEIRDGKTLDEADGDGGMNARDDVAKDNNLAPRTVSRIIRLNNLCPYLLDLADQGNMPLYAGDDLSYVGMEEQVQLAAYLQAHPKAKVTMDAAKELRRIFESGGWSDATTATVFEKPRAKAENAKKAVRIPRSDLPESLTALPDQDIIQKLLETYKLYEAANGAAS